MAAYTETIHRRIETNRATIEIVDSFSSAGVSYAECHNSYRLVWLATSRHLAVTIECLESSTNACGQLSFFPANIPLVITPRSKLNGFRTIRCRFNPEWLSLTSNLPLNWTDSWFEQYSDIHNDRLERAITWMGQEAYSPSLASELIVESLSAIVAREVSQAFQSSPSKLRVRTTGRKLSKLDYERIIEYISCFAYKPLSMEELARECGVSESLLYKSFKQCAGVTIHKYVEQVRLSLAKNLLENTDLKLKEVAHRVGFSGASAFCRAFKKSAGLTPNNYRIETRDSAGTRRSTQ